MTPAEIGRALRCGVLVSDDAFDRHLPRAYQVIAGRYWTPVEVGAKAAWWLAELGARSVLDVGAGVGKFCVTAVLSRDLRLTGIEHRTELAGHAGTLAAQFGVSQRVKIVTGRMESIDTSVFDAIYAYNPFGENLFSPDERIDSAVDLSAGRYRRDVRFLEGTLESVPNGAMLASYYGFGGRIPDSFECIREAPVGTDVLRIWRKSRPARGLWWSETAGTFSLAPRARHDVL